LSRFPAPADPAAALRWRSVGVLALLALAALAGLVLLLQRLQPGTLAPLHGAAARVPCVSYAPFRRPGHSPFDASLRVAPALIEADLRQLATITGCVRTYGLDHGLDAVPAIARRLGLRVVLGAWIGRDAAANDEQLERALALARAHADVVDLLVVGNEVLLRRELAPQALAALLARARRESPVPVAYADVWEFWLRHAEVLRPHVDRAAVHVLPYWEDDPVPNAQAVQHVHAVAAQVRAALAPLPVWVAETGWPAAGRQRAGAVPGVAAQTRFVHALLVREGAEPLRFNLIEGFDQPWRRRLEGAMGGYWGWFDADGRARVRLDGTLPPDAAVRGALLAAALGGMAALIVAGVWGARRRATRSALVPWFATWTLGGAALAAGAWLQWQLLGVWSRSPWEAAGIALVTLLAAGTALLELPRLAARLAGAGAAPPGARPGVIDAWRRPTPAGPRWRATLYAALLFCTAALALQLVFDGRYRPLQWPLGAVSGAIVLALALCGERLHDSAREERWLAAVCAACALALAAIEGVANHEALAAAATWLAVASLARPHRARAGRAPASADSSRPTEAGPAA
jgi:exo-beta-1,3-glucanase (GH17 family)